MTAIHSAVPSSLVSYSPSHLASFSCDYMYNDLRGGRVRALLSASLHYERRQEQGMVLQMKRLFDKLVEDAFFYGNSLIWIAPPSGGTKKLLFTRNIGVYLGLWLIRTYLNREASIPILLNNISFDAELFEISSPTHRKRIRMFLKEEISSLMANDVHELIKYYIRTKTQVVLEAIVCLCFKSGLFRVTSIAQQVKTLLLETDPTALALVSELKTVFANRSALPSFSIDLSTGVVATLIRNRFKSIFQYCGNQFVETVLLNNLATDELKPNAWLTVLHDHYPDRNVLFNQLIRRERFLLKVPLYIFNDQTECGQFNYHLDFLRTCYQTDLNTLYTYRFRLATQKFTYQFNTFCIKLLLNQDFAQLKHPSKLRYFRQYYKNVQFSLLLVKRHEKEVIWQGRSFTDNLEVDFLFFFMNNFRSINEYKTHFALKRLTDTEMLEIFFWALELGIIEPAPSALSGG